MKKILVVLSLSSVAAQAHESLAPHEHPHGLSILPGIDTVACALFALMAGLIIYWKLKSAR